MNSPPKRAWNSSASARFAKQKTLMSSSTERVATGAKREAFAEETDGHVVVATAAAGRERHLVWPLPIDGPLLNSSLNLNRASLPPRTSSSVPAPTNARCASGPSLMATEIRSRATRLGGPPFPEFERGVISPHRAAFDVVVTAAIFEELIKNARWSELVQWSDEPALYTKFHFGKSRGQRCDDIAASDPDYLRWIIEKSELDAGIKRRGTRCATISCETRSRI
jgi:hypothetical protein